MNIQEFKQAIESNTLSSSLIIAVCPNEDAEFIFHQYLNKYIELNNIPYEIIDSITNTSSNIFGIQQSNLQVYYTKKLTEVFIPKMYKLWIRCSSIDKKVKEQFSEYVVDMPKLEDWQLKDYVYSLCEKLPHKDLDYISATHKNIYRLDSELSKITIFPEYDKVYPKIKSQLFNEVSDFNVFNLITCFVKCDIINMTNILYDIDSIDVDIFGLITLLINNFKKVINVQLSRNPTPESTGLNSKQLWAIKKYSTGIYNRNQLLEIYKLLTNCDYLIKSGFIATDMLLDYLIVKIMSVKERIT